jgi:hypothetical protein
MIEHCSNSYRMGLLIGAWTFRIALVLVGALVGRAIKKGVASQSDEPR